MIKKIFSTLWKLLIAFAVILFIASHFSTVIHGFATRYVTHPIRGFYAALFNTAQFPVFEIGAVGLLIAIPFLIWRYIFSRGSLKPLVIVIQFVVLGYIVTVGIDGAIPERAAVDNLGEDDYITAFDKVSQELAFISERLTEDGGVSDLEIRSLAASYAYGELDTHITHVPQIKTTAFGYVTKKLGVTAYYAPVTAEIILSSTVPNVSRPSVAMHELMHFFGIMTEDGAIYHSIVASMNSENDFIKYSAALEAFVRIGGEVSLEKYLENYTKLPPRVKKDLETKRAEVKESVLGDVLNDRVISLRDGRGADSYRYSAAPLALYFINKALPVD